MLKYLVRLILLGDKMDVAMTKMSSKGQVVIPIEMRKNIKEGDKLLIIRNEDQLILKLANELDFNEDIAFAKKTDDALERIKSGKGIKMNFDEFIDEMKKW